jgi:hypothetical protein
LPYARCISEVTVACGLGAVAVPKAVPMAGEVWIVGGLGAYGGAYGGAHGGPYGGTYAYLGAPVVPMAVP